MVYPLQLELWTNPAAQDSIRRSVDHWVDLCGLNQRGGAKVRAPHGSDSDPFR